MWLIASNAPPVRGMFSPPRHPIFVPNIANGQRITIASPYQNPEPRKRRVKLSFSFSHAVSRRIPVMCPPRRADLATMVPARRHRVAQL